MKKLSIIFLTTLILSLTGCSGRADIDSSFSVISELCKANFAPTAEEEYLDTFKKYKDTCISEDLLAIFFDMGKQVHTNVTMTDYICKYYKKSDTDYSRYVATMHLSNGTIYTDIEVTFFVNAGKIVNVIISDNEK